MKKLSLSKKMCKCLVAIFLSIVIIGSNSSLSLAATYGMKTFGGRTVSFPCLCSGSSFIYVTEPVEVSLTFFWGTPQYRNKMLPATGVWTLGLSIPEADLCYVFVIIGCAHVDAEGLISPWVGTSLLP